MRQIRYFMSITFLVFFSTVALSGPFGIEKGMPITELETVENTNGLVVILKQPPKPHPKLKNYVVGHTPKTGVCSINAVTSRIKNDRFGKKTRALFKNLREQLESKYGKFEEIKGLKKAGVWNEKDEWMMSVHKNERTYGIWKKQVEGSLSHLYMKIIANGPSSGGVKIMYQFENFEKCKKVKNQKSSSVL